MRNTRRSLLTFGALMAAVMLLLPAAALAQADAPTDLTTSDVKWNSVKVMWMWTVGSGDEATKFEVVYEQVDTGVAFTDGVAMSMSVNHDDAEQTTTNAYATTVSGLMPGKRYIIAVRSLNEDGDRSALTTPVNEGSGDIDTLPAPKPERVSGIMVEAGDKMLMVTWSPTYPTTGSETGLSTVEYHLQYRTTQTADASAGAWTPETDGGMTIMGMEEATISNLMNGTSYDVRIRAENNAGGKGEYSRVTPETRGTPGMMPTPALPLFGMLALGAGLVAAGRRRLHAQRLLKN